MTGVRRAAVAAMVAISVVLVALAGSAAAQAEEDYTPPVDVQSECANCSDVVSKPAAPTQAAPAQTQPLAFTGSNSLAYTAVALGVMAAGAALLLASRFQLGRASARSNASV